MRRIISILFALAVSLLLGACAVAEAPQNTTIETSQDTTASTTQSVAAQHSELYIKGVSVKQMQHYFNEVVLNAEYTENASQASLVQKWTEPIYYDFQGNVTDEDLVVLNKLFAQLNEVKGFPGIAPAGTGKTANLTISFLDAADFQKNFADVVNGEDAYGAAQYWYYNETNEIYSGRIGYRTDISQNERNSVFLEEIVNVLGLSDTEKRTDSIVYQYSNEAVELSAEDWAIVKLLYHPLMQSGMDEAACKLIVGQLYY